MSVEVEKIDTADSKLNDDEILSLQVIALKNDLVAQNIYKYLSNTLHF